MILYIQERYKLNKEQLGPLNDAVLVGDKQNALRLLRNLPVKATLFPMQGGGKKFVLSREEAMWDAAASYATSISDSCFLSYLKTFPTSSFFSAVIAEC